MNMFDVYMNLTNTETFLIFGVHFRFSFQKLLFKSVESSTIHRKKKEKLLFASL